jgi:arsenate reductase
MSSVTIYHNQNCSSSRHAVEVAKDLGLDVEIVQYLKTPPTREQLTELVGILDVEPAQLVRRDANFTALSLSDNDVVTAEQVVNLLVEHPKLLQRPVLVCDGKAFIGRPKDAVADRLRKG